MPLVDALGYKTRLARVPAQGRLYDIFEMFRRLDLSMFFSQITLTITVGAPPAGPCFLHVGACVTLCLSPPSPSSPSSSLPV